MTKLDYSCGIESTVVKIAELLDDPLDRRFADPMRHPVIELLDKFVWLPEKQVQLPIIAAYLCINTELLKQLFLPVPYLFHHGPSGTGKSQVAILASLLHSLTIFSSDSTAAGLRQEIEATDKLGRICTYLLFDDLNHRSFDGEDGSKKLTIFKSGYNPLTSVIVLGGKEGVSNRLDVFCPKIFSSCHPFHVEGNLKELMRRSLIIQHAPANGFEGDEIGDFRWEGCSKKFEEAWIPAGRAHLRFVDSLKEIKKSIKKSGLSDHKRVIAPALIATGVAARIWETTHQGIEALKTFSVFEEQAYKVKSSFEDWLTNWVGHHRHQALHPENRELDVYFFSSIDLINAAEEAFIAGELMEKPTREVLKAALESGRGLNYRLLSKAASKQFYKEAIWYKEEPNG